MDRWKNIYRTVVDLGTVNVGDIHYNFSDYGINNIEKMISAKGIQDDGINFTEILFSNAGYWANLYVPLGNTTFVTQFTNTGYNVYAIFEYTKTE